VRHYCPELSKLPDRYIYEPWKASLAEQKKAQCVIGVDYPARMLDDDERRRICLARMKAAYEAGFKGNAPEVIDGSAEPIVREKYESAGSPPRKKQRSGPDPKQRTIEAFVNHKRRL